MRRGSARLRIAILSAVFALSIAGASPAAEPDRTYPVGIKQVEFADTHYGPRTLSMAVFYPAIVEEGSAKPFVMPFFTKLNLYKDAEIAFDGETRPLVMLSHGRGSTGLSYAWFAQTLASHGYIVAAPYHWRANTYDSTVAYLANKLWQRPVDVSLDIDFLLSDPAWSKYIDPGRIGGRRPQPRGLYRALARRRQGQPRQVPRLPAGLEEQPANPRASPRRAAARPRARAQGEGRPRQGGVRHGARHHQGVRHG